MAGGLRRLHDDGGASGTFFFHYLPWGLDAECGGGSFGFFDIDKNYKIKGYFSQYFAAQVITKEWVQPVDAEHRLFRATSDDPMVTAYAVERPDGQWSVMLINKDHDNPHSVKVGFNGRGFSGPVDRVTFGAAEYQWHPDGVNGHADPDGPPSKSKIPAAASYELPKSIHRSITRPACRLTYRTRPRAMSYSFPGIEPQGACGAGPCPANGKPEACAVGQVPDLPENPTEWQVGDCPTKLVPVPERSASRPGVPRSHTWERRERGSSSPRFVFARVRALR